jgi:transposase
MLAIGSFLCNTGSKYLRNIAMFVRVKTTPNSPRKSVQIVESIRTGDKVKQKILRYVGIATDDSELAKLLDVAEYIKAKIEYEHTPTLWSPEETAEMAISARKDQLKQKKSKDDKPINVDLKKLREEQRTIVGIHEVYGKIYEELGFDNLFASPKRNELFAKILKHIVLARIACPKSKRASVKMLEEDFGISLNLDKVYTMMDKIDDAMVDRIQNKVHYATKQVLGGKINVLFYDATTLYFESFTEDDLKQNGYSKDFKFNQPQVILALLVTQEGLPVGYEVFPGSFYEGHTVIPILTKLKTNYDLEKVIFVGDKGMLNEDNLSFLEEHNFYYIVGARLKNLSEELTKKVLDLESYEIEDKEDKYLVIDKKDGRRVIVSHNATRARKDKHDRDKAVEKVLKKLQKSKDPKSLISNYGYKKYISMEGESKIGLDEDKLLKESKWDGLHGVITNLQDREAKEVLAHYRGLWEIEESFRISKHDLKVRPIFHWVPPRVRAHLAIAFMAFSCVRHLQHRVGLQYQRMSPEAIRWELLHVQTSFLRHKENRKLYCIPSKVSNEAKKIYQTVGLKLSAIPFELENQKQKKQKRAKKSK